MSTTEVYTGWFLEVIGNKGAEYVPGHLNLSEILCEVGIYHWLSMTQ